ncbi:response regulator [Marinicella meishanensis]|uniref:response regulator n=1 Tax=Marinicella meishanensis TaxID=2873263 RepID=UPI001CBAD3D4
MELTYNLLVVDDVSENIQVVMNILKEQGYEFSYALNGSQAQELLKTNSFDLVLLDVMMPDINGFEVCQFMKQDPRLQDIPVIFLTARVDVDSITEGFNLGGVDYITKPFHSSELIARVKTHLDLYQAKKVLQQNNLVLQKQLKSKEQRILSELEQNQKEMIFMLTELMEATSDETGQHIKRVAEISRLLAFYHPSLNAEDEDIIFHASPMHDIGKITIPQSILHKDGPLTDEEREVMKTHTTNAYQFLKLSPRKFIKAAAMIAYHHHEKWDGTGYPQGLQGDDIHIYGRIVAIADVFDALTHKRKYKDAWPVQEAVDYIVDLKGKQFDPNLVDIFIQHLDEFVAIAEMS